MHALQHIATLNIKVATDIILPMCFDISEPICFRVVTVLFFFSLCSLCLFKYANTPFIGARRSIIAALEFVKTIKSHRFKFGLRPAVSC